MRLKILCHLFSSSCDVSSAVCLCCCVTVLVLMFLFDRSCLNLISDTHPLVSEERDLIESLRLLNGFGVSILPVQGNPTLCTWLRWHIGNDNNHCNYDKSDDGNLITSGVGHSKSFRMSHLQGAAKIARSQSRCRSVLKVSWRCCGQFPAVLLTNDPGYNTSDQKIPHFIHFFDCLSPVHTGDKLERMFDIRATKITHFRQSRLSRRQCRPQQAVEFNFVASVYGRATKSKLHEY